MQRYYAGLSFAILATLAASAVAQRSAPTTDHSSHRSAAAARGTAVAPTEGEVRRVDREAGRITLRHEEILNLEMPAMTMVFRVKDRAMLDKVKEGQKVRFTAERSDGGYTLSTLEPQE